MWIIGQRYENTANGVQTLKISILLCTKYSTFHWLPKFMVCVLFRGAFQSQYGTQKELDTV